jgi:hypothetical protein
MDEIASNTLEDQTTEDINDGSEDGNTIMSQQSESADNSTNEDRLPDNNATHNQDMDDESPNTDEEDVEDPYEQLIMIDDINIVTEMNTSQLAIQQEEEQDTTNQAPTHGYNLRDALQSKKREFH